jgi:hypothetical protein
VLICTSFYLELCICSDAISHRSDEGTALHYVQISKQLRRRPPATMRQAFREENISLTRKVGIHQDRKRDRWRTKPRKSMLIIYLVSRGLFKKNSYCQAKQSIPNTTVAFYVDCLKMWRLRPELWRHENWMVHHDRTNRTESPPFWHKLGDRGRIADGAEHPHRTQLLACI